MSDGSLGFFDYKNIPIFDIKCCLLDKRTSAFDVRRDTCLECIKAVFIIFKKGFYHIFSYLFPLTVLSLGRSIENVRREINKITKSASKHELPLVR